MAVSPTHAFYSMYSQEIKSKISLKMFVQMTLKSPILLLVSVIQPGNLIFFLLYSG